MKIEEQMGEKIRELRGRNGWSQQELADRTELTKGFISQMERGRTAPSISTLQHIVECLGTNLSDFFYEEEIHQIVYTKETYLEKEDDSSNLITWLAPGAQDTCLQPVLLRIEPGQSFLQDNPHEGEEFGYVLAGKIRLDYGAETYTVRAGDSFLFPANRKHRIGSDSAQVSIVLLVHKGERKGDSPF